MSYNAFSTAFKFRLDIDGSPFLITRLKQRDIKHQSRFYDFECVVGFVLCGLPLLSMNGKLKHRLIIMTCLIAVMLELILNMTHMEI